MKDFFEHGVATDILGLVLIVTLIGSHLIMNFGA
jgi:hypothetical protein